DAASRPLPCFLLSCPRRLDTNLPIPRIWQSIMGGNQAPRGARCGLLCTQLDGPHLARIRSNMIGLPHCGSYFFALLVARAASSLDSVAAAFTPGLLPEPASGLVSRLASGLTS